MAEQAFTAEELAAGAAFSLRAFLERTHGRGAPEGEPLPEHSVDGLRVQLRLPNGEVRIGKMNPASRHPRTYPSPPSTPPPGPSGHA